MGKPEVFENEELGVLEDKTEALILHSKRTERLKKRQTRKAQEKPVRKSHDLLNLPYELIIDVLVFLGPGDIITLKRVSKSFHAFITQEEHTIARVINATRFQCLEKCFRLPVLLSDVDPAMHYYLKDPERQELMTIHRKPYYQHVQQPDPAEICTCLTCLLRWSALCIVVDFAYWQDHLDKGEPIPMIPRGRFPEWNQSLVARNAALVRKALYSPLCHSRLLELHLNSTVRSIRRHAPNKSIQRQRFHMTQDDVDSGADHWLSRSGPPTYDFPYYRNNYYMLESWLPNRSWSSDLSQWMYLPAEQHDRDLEFVVKWAVGRKSAGEQAVANGGAS
ncbi:hypothetical protein F4809DRAFT_229776 [Biscogniauxia mediterranea]|nr:hypothetical protein F4809DRAFT_229776 [Biscogniauxia mediterranea]